MRALKYIHLWHVLGWCMVGAIVYASLTSDPGVDLSIALSDKLLHFLGYFAVSAWFLQIYEHPNYIRNQIAFLLLLGIGLEIAQGYTDARTPEWLDGAANTLGVLAPLLLPRDIFIRNSRA